MVTPSTPTWLRAPGVVVAVVALLIALPGLGNTFAYDDVEVIVEDADLHHLSTALPRAFEPYLGGQMLRPVPLLAFAGQWSIGEGSPLPFRVVSLGLYAVVGGLVVLLCRRAGASPAAAMAGGLVFAVHPVHVEVTANGVGQLELLAALAVLGAACWYLRARLTGAWRRRDTAVLVALLLIALHTKESAYVLPGLLLAIEGLVITDTRSWRTRVAELREPGLVVVAVTLASLAIRNVILGELGGGRAHSALAGMGWGDRTLAFLSLVLEWARLLLWPARLQAEYGPPALDPGMAFGPRHLLGGMLVVAIGLGAAATWRRSRLVALGLLWMVLSLAPVANLLFPTGILVAERTLFLPSIGLALIVAGVVEGLRGPLASRPSLRAGLATASLVAVLAAGIWSGMRQGDWRDTSTILARAVEVGPTTYRAHLLLGREQRRLGDLAAAERSFREAGRLWAGDPRPFEELGQLLRSRGDCDGAIPVLERGVLADSTSDVARGRLVECLIVERRWAEAEREIARGLAQGVAAYRGARSRIEAARGAPPTR